MRRLVIYASALLLAASCSQRPKLTEAIAHRWGCSYNALLQAYRELHRDLPKGQHYAPEKGWSACELLAHVGPPDSIEGDSVMAFWVYNLPGSMRVSVGQGQVLMDSIPDRGWVVQSDGW